MKRKTPLSPDEDRWLRADRETHKKIAQLVWERNMDGKKTMIKDILRKLIVEEKNWKDV